MELTRIHPNHAKKFIKLDDDFRDNPPRHYTLTPSTHPQYPASSGWDDITYYTGRAVDMYSNREGEGDSWVYILSNPSIPHQLKIGSTSKSIDVRATQISRSTGVPTEFVVEFGFKCFNAEAAEREIHKVLKDCRVSMDREFFRVSLQEAKGIVEKIGKKYL
jgi:hypothetical protein